MLHLPRAKAKENCNNSLTLNTKKHISETQQMVHRFKQSNYKAFGIKT
jgi:hypothetical protein